jgi:hypothetical protein
MRRTWLAGCIALVGMALPLALCGGAALDPSPAERNGARPTTREAPLGSPRTGAARGRTGKGRAAAQQEVADNLTTEQTTELLDLARQHFPRIYERLIRARQNDPAAFRRMWRRVSSNLVRLQEIKKRDPQLAQKLIVQQQAEMEIFDLRQSYKAASSEAERARIRTEVRNQLEIKFNARIERLKAEAADLRRRLDEQARRLADQERSKDQLIDKELEQVLARRGPT